MRSSYLLLLTVCSVITVITTLWTGICYSQTLIPQVGITLSTSKLSSDETFLGEIDAGFRQGFIAGVGTDLPITERLGLQSGIFYAQKGSKSDRYPVSGFTSGGNEYLLNYLEFPLSLRSLIVTGAKSKFYVKAGASFAFLLGGKMDVYASNSNVNYAEELKVRYYPIPRMPEYDNEFYVSQNTDIGLHAGFGMILKNKLNLELNYTLGLSDFEYESLSQVTSRNRVFQVTAGIPFAVRSQVEAASERTKKDISYSLTIGYSSTNLYGSEVERRADPFAGQPHELFSRPGIDISALAIIKLLKPVYLSTGLGFIQKGGRIDDDATYEVNPELNCMYVPVLLSIRPLELNRLSASIEGGVALNYEIAAQNDFVQGIGNDYTWNKLIPSSSMGGSLYYRIADKLSIKGEMRVINDLKPFFERDLQGESYEIKTKGKVFSLGVIFRPS